MNVNVWHTVALHQGFRNSSSRGLFAYLSLYQPTQYWRPCLLKKLSQPWLCRLQSMKQTLHRVTLCVEYLEKPTRTKLKNVLLCFFIRSGIDYKECYRLKFRCWWKDCSKFILFSYLHSAPPFPQPACPDAGWSPYDAEQTQSTSQHSLSSATHSNHQAYRQTIFHSGGFHLPGRAQIEHTRT